MATRNSGPQATTVHRVDCPSCRQGDKRAAKLTDVEDDLDLGDTTGRGGDARELELSEEVVVLGAGTLALVDLDEDARLVVGVGREGLGLLGRDGRVAGDELGHDTAGGLDTGRERGDVEEEEVLGLLGRVAGEDGGLDGGAVRDGLVRVDRLVGLLAVEKIRDELLDTRDTGRTADEDNLVDRLLVDLRVAEDLLDRLHGAAEQVGAELLETGTGDRGVEVDALEERVDLDSGLGGRRQGALGALAGGAETAEGAGVGREVLLVLALELGAEVGDEAVVKVLTAEVGVTGGGLDLEDALLDREERDVERAAAQVENEDVLLALGLLVEAVRDRGGGRLVDDAEDVEARDGTGVLGRLTLRVVEVGRDGDDGVADRASEVCLGRLLHLEEDHRRDLLRGELLGLALVLDLDDRLGRLVDDLERPVCVHGVLVSFRREGGRRRGCRGAGEGTLTLHVGLDLGVTKLATDETLGIKDGAVEEGWCQYRVRDCTGRGEKRTHLCGFMATWFLAASPMRRSVSLQEGRNQHAVSSARVYKVQGLT